MRPSSLLRDVRPDAAVRAAAGLTLDIGGQPWRAAELDELLELAERRRALSALRDMAAGALVNPGEGRAALHTALRDPRPDAPGQPEVGAQLRRLLACAAAIRDGSWRGASGAPISDIVNIGIGGSAVGPQAVWQALRPPSPRLRLDFLTAADGVQFERLTAPLEPSRTLAVISSKSFSTVETLANAAAFRRWLAAGGISGADQARHLLVVSARPDAAASLGLPPENQFSFWDWVGGRFSLWSAVGLPLAIALGPETFSELLAGARDMDCHALEAAPADNLPLLLALMSYGNAVWRGVVSHCLLPYDERLRGLVPWLQQLEMESLGKHLGPDGRPLAGPTGQAVWGGHGNEGQHSFFQWLRAGTHSNCLDLLWCQRPGHGQEELDRLLRASFRAQAEALTRRDGPPGCHNAVNLITIERLTPRSLGALLVLYEHKTALLGSLFGLNPFDQPGVELGKRLCRQALAAGER